MLRRLLSTKPLQSDLALLILRVGAGVFLFTHGLFKIQNFAMMSPHWPDPFGVGSTFSLVLTITAEAFCSVLVAAGAYTRLALIPQLILMSIISFHIHAGEPFGKRELPLFYLVVFVTLFLTGPGKYSLDGALKRS